MKFFSRVSKGFLAHDLEGIFQGDEEEVVDFSADASRLARSKKAVKYYG